MLRHKVAAHTMNTSTVGTRKSKKIHLNNAQDYIHNDV